MERKNGQLWIGERTNEDNERTGEAVELASSSLTTHGVIVGMTGSGKTGMGVVLLEEALLAGIPVLAIDPKGDLSNLALTFPNLAAEDFQPWIDQAAAKVEGVSVEEMAATTAKAWSDGLDSWDLQGDDVAALAKAAAPVIYTPGGVKGIPLDVLGRLSAPSVTEPSARQDEIDSTVGGLLGLIGVDSDPLSGREHILLANLVARSWEAGKDLDLTTLLRQIADPPMRKLGVLDLDEFFPSKDREALVMKLNGLLASPNFSTWAQGAPLDIEKMLFDDQGKARAAVISISHLEESERHFATTLILSKMISWMRTKPGTSELRALVYIDEVAGYAPPSKNPSPKQPILTMLKQARAHGVGMILATQNPVDLDYKAISNAGTWLIGRLQTDQDKSRLVDGLKAADGSVDMDELSETISGLNKRQFVLRTTESSELPLLTSRWALSYLAGPLTGDQITELMSSEIAKLGNDETASTTDAEGASPASSATAKPTLSDDESAIHPKVPDSLTVRYVAANAPWLEDVDGDPDGDRLRPALASRVDLLFDETKADLRHNQEWEAIIPLEGDRIDLDAAISVDFDDRDLLSEAPTEPVYILPPFDLTVSAIRSASSDLKKKLASQLTLTLYHNAELKLWSRPGEPTDAFQQRCEAAAQDGADAEAAKLRESFDKKRQRAELAVAKAEDRVEVLEVDAEGRRQSHILDIGTSVLGGLLGGRSRTRSLASAARRVSSSRQQKAKTESRLEAAANRLDEKVAALEDLEYEASEALLEIDAKWSEKVEALEEKEIPLERTDINVEDLILIWVPVSV